MEVMKLIMKLSAHLNPIHQLTGKLNNSIITTGLDTSDGTATSEDIRLNKVAYVDGMRVIGNSTYNSDTSQDTVISSKLVKGYSAHDAEGNLIIGEAIEAIPTYWSKYGASYTEYLELADENITEVCMNCYRSCTHLKKVTISAPNCISLHSYSFADNLNLEEVIITSPLTTLESTVFFADKNLKRVVLPNTIMSTNEGNFKSCINLEEVIIEEGFSASLNISYSDNLTKASLENLISNLANLATTDTSKQLILGSANISKIDQQYLDLATTKNWILS